MIPSSRIRMKPLGHLCQRLGMALEAGVDLRTALKHEADRAHGTLHRHLVAILGDINQGESLTGAIEGCGHYFPTLVREMVAVGEQTGHLDTIFVQLANHYQEQVTLRRNFLGSISWPLTELGIALLVIGLLIWLIDWLPNKTDVLGFGLVGEQGVVIYLTILAAIGAALALVIGALGRGVMWTRPIQYIVMYLPGIGGALRTLALARLTWSMHLTMNAGMDLRRSLKLSLRSTRNAVYIDHAAVIDAAILNGSSICDAFRSTGGYPVEFLDTLAVSEESGRIVETMGILARQYHERAKNAIVILTSIAGWVVWVVIAMLIISVIFRLFRFYLNAINNAANMEI